MSKDIINITNQNKFELKELSKRYIEESKVISSELEMYKNDN